MKIRNKIYKVAAAVALSLTGTAQATAQDSLLTYIVAAIRNNPGVMGEYRAYQAQVAGACGAGTLGDPEVSVGVFPSPMQHVNGKQLATVSVMQMFPWFGTLRAGRQQMEYKAEAAYQQFRADGIALAYQMQQQWYDLLATQEKIRSVKDQLRLLKDIQQVALYQYKSPQKVRQGRMSDQLRLQAEQTDMEEQVATLTDRMKLQEQQFNLAMHRQQDSPLVIPDSIVLRGMPVVAWDEIERNDPALNRLTAEGKAYEAQGEKARGMGLPMIGLGIEYMLNGKVKAPVMADMNGNDMLMPMVKVTVPIYRKKINSARRSAVLMQQSAEYGYLKQQDALRSQYLSIGQRAADVKRKVELYDREVGILDNTLKLMTAEYANGTTSLTDILQTMRGYIDYALKRAEAYARYNTIVAEYERLAARYDYAVRDGMNNHVESNGKEVK